MLGTSRAESCDRVPISNSDDRDIQHNDTGVVSGSQIGPKQSRSEQLPLGKVFRRSFENFKLDRKGLIDGYDDGPAMG